MPLPRTPTSLFTPSVVRSIATEPGAADSFGTHDFSVSTGTALGHSSSFRYDLPGTGIKSTQQLNVDWSDFKNHVFFNSAQVKTNDAFTRIFDNFPFDGTKKELELFFDGMTGFEKYVFDQWPRNKGYLFLSGTAGSQATGGTVVTIQDLAGTEYPTLTRNPTGYSVLNPGATTPLTIEFHLFVPPVSNSNQVVLQKMSGSNQGFSVHLYSTGSTTTCNLRMSVLSGSYHLQTGDVPLTKDQFNHLAFVWDRTPGTSKLFAYANQDLVASSSMTEIGNLIFDAARFYVGSGSAITGFTPANTLSGALDELRVWHSVRTKSEREEFSTKGVYADTNLKLYLKFNEPSGSNTALVIDHSGNGLHGNLSTDATTIGVREIASSSVAGTPPLTHERSELCPILFPDHPDIGTLQDNLLLAATTYDEANPNWIVNLIPPHFLMEGRVQDALDTEDGPILTTIRYDAARPKSANLGDTQVLLLLLYTWAKFFDELKLYLDSFAHIMHVDYDSEDTVPDQFLHILAERFGIQLPPLFVGTSIEQFINAENTGTAFGVGTNTMQYIQNQVWRRILINIRDVLSSKGTVHSVKSFIRSVGIDPDNNFRIREFGGPTKKSLGNTREQRSEIAAMLDFVSGGLLQTPFLSGARVEPGDPVVMGGASDGLFTSGSWAVEGIFKFETPLIVSQSLFRLMTTSSLASDLKLVAANVVATSGSGAILFVRPNASSSAPTLSMSLGGFDIMDGQPWSVCFGRFRGDRINQLSSSSYFFRVAKQSFGKITEEYTVSQSFNDNDPVGTNGNVWNFITGSVNPSGAFLVVGSQSLGTTAMLLNDSTTPAGARVTDFDGKIAQLRFWSKGLSLKEWKEHVRNFKSLGVQTPRTNFNFVTATSGSFERLRLDLSMDQVTTQSTGTGTLSLYDFSQNNLHASGTGFPATSSIIAPQMFYYSYLSPRFDESATDNKVRVRSYQNFNNVFNDEDNYAAVAPVYDIEQSETPQDNTRFSIDFSVVDTLNQDIVNMFSVLDEFDNTIGSPELMFSGDYPNLEVLRDVYFNRLTDRIQLKTFFEFYKWFDTNVGGFIAQLIPRKTTYLGVNYCVESHMLERPKFEYQFADVYIGDSVRHAQRDTILLQLFSGFIAKM